MVCVRDLMVAASVAAALLVSASGVEAQDANALAARALFNEGIELSDHGQWHEAIDRFRRALALRDSAVIAYNLGIALEHDGHPVEAAERFRRVTRDEAAGATMRSDAQAALTEAEAAIAWVTTTWEGDSAELALHVDGAERPLALLGARMPLDPGDHHVALVRGGVEVAAGRITVRASEVSSLALETLETPVVEVVPVDDDVASEAAGGGGGERGEDPAPWIGLGVGAGVVVVAGAITLAIVLTPMPDAAPFRGSLGTVVLGR